MGYTRSWSQTRKLTVREWAQLAACVESIQRLSGVDLAGPLGYGAPIVTRGRIAFNGAAQTGEDYESFVLCRVPGLEWSFCKTARMPYDAAVAAVLTAADRIAPGAFSELSADGGPEEWAEADALCDYLGLPRRKRVASRESVAAKAEACSVAYTGSGIFDVTSPSGALYSVNVVPDEGFEHWGCTCPWGEHGGAGCAHVRSVALWLDRETQLLRIAERREVAA